MKTERAVREQTSNYHQLQKSFPELQEYHVGLDQVECKNLAEGCDDIISHYC